MLDKNTQIVDNITLVTDEKGNSNWIPFTFVGLLDTKMSLVIRMENHLNKQLAGKPVLYAQNNKLIESTEDIDKFLICKFE